MRSVERNSLDGQQRVIKRINGLFEKVKQTYNHIFRESDEILLNQRVVAYIASQIPGYDFLNSPVDVKGTAYEEIVGANLKGDRGQFFTHKDISSSLYPHRRRKSERRSRTIFYSPQCGENGCHHVESKRNASYCRSGLWHGRFFGRSFDPCN